MTLFWNNKLLSEWPADLLQAQRAVYYADGLFETMYAAGGTVALLPRHWERLKTGLQLLDFELPGHWSAAFWAEKLAQLPYVPHARLRLTVWRSAGGLYAGADNRPQWLLSQEPLAEAPYVLPDRGLAVGVCPDVRLPIDRFSNLKTLNAARYAAAARWAAACGLDDALILNTAERLAETGSSNFWWIEGKTLYTPPLTEGCVAGVMRAEIIKTAPTLGFAVQQKTTTFAAMMEQAEEVFLSNALRGIRWVETCGGRKFISEHTSILAELIKKFLTGSL